VVVDLSAQAIADPAAKGKKADDEDLILDKALELFGVQKTAKVAEKKAA
jgi:hypothetical protein